MQSFQAFLRSFSYDGSSGLPRVTQLSANAEIDVIKAKDAQMIVLRDLVISCSYLLADAKRRHEKIWLVGLPKSSQISFC